jgi:site-specific recombinase XerD
MDSKTKEAVERFLENGNRRGGDFSPNTIGRYRLDLEEFFSFVKKDFTQVTRIDCENFKRYLKGRFNHSIKKAGKKIISKKTLWHKIVAVKSFYRFVICDGDYGMVKSPMYFKVRNADLKSPQEFIEAQILSREEVRTLLEGTKNVRDNAIITLLYNCGMRVSELTGMNLESIDMEKRRMSLNGKTGPRTIDFNEDCYQALKIWLLIRGKPKTNALFTTKFRKRIDPETVRDIIKESCRDKISRSLTPRSFRNTMITHALEDGVSIVELAHYVGHSSVNTTMGYCAIAKLGNTILTRFKGIHK